MPRRTKFLSLRRKFPPEEARNAESLSELRRSSTTTTASASAGLAPATNSRPAANQAEDRENHEHENVAYFFSAADSGATTLTGLLDTTTASNSARSTDDSSRYAYGGQDGEEAAALVRNALRSRERDRSEEKWVCYSEVVKEEEVSSSSVVDQWRAGPGIGIQRLSLKLDYEEILNAWSDKGPLIVPDISDDLLLYEDMSRGCNSDNVGCNWRVPEIENVGSMRLTMKNGEREASVLRYKAKRLNRLFSKKIRYQVRKHNADKRPRLKGRFVKRN